MFVIACNRTRFSLRKALISMKLQTNHVDEEVRGRRALRIGSIIIK